MGSSTGDLLVWEDDKLEEVLRNGNRRVAIHAEDEMRLRARKPIAEEGRVADHPLWRDEETALMATRRILELARRTGRRIHVLHVTTSEEMALLADYKDVASVEATPQHLTLEAPDCYKRLGTYAQMNPPVRDARHRAAIWQALGQGIVDVIGSDHAPHLKAEKEKPYPQSPSGMPGVQTLLPLLLNHLNEGRLSLERLVDLTSAGAQRLFNLAGKGRLAVGYDGDYTLVDLKKNWVIEETWLASKCGWSPFTGMSITGQPVGTIIRGARVMWQGEVAGTPLGRPIRFQDTLVQG
jgi:dihydroorotase